MKTKLAASPRQPFLCLSKGGALSSGRSTDAKQYNDVLMRRAPSSCQGSLLQQALVPDLKAHGIRVAVDVFDGHWQGLAIQHLCTGNRKQRD